MFLEIGLIRKVRAVKAIREKESKIIGENKNVFFFFIPIKIITLDNARSMLFSQVRSLSFDKPCPVWYRASSGYIILVMRAFIAIDLPKKLKEKIFDFGQEITKKLDIRLVEKENLHLTLIFLGDIPEERIKDVTEILEGLPVLYQNGTGTAGAGEIHLTLGSWEPFPSKRKPFGIWINVEGETRKLFSLYKKIIDGLLAKNFVLERNSLKFSPHITVGRMKSGGVRSMGAVHLEENFTAGKVTLFSSELTEKGSKYTKIGEFEVQ